MKTRIKRTIALIAGLLVLITVPSFAAPTAPVKEEVVYAHLSGNGEVNQVYVVNAFRDADGAITDHGKYSEVVNLTTTDQLVRRDDRVEIPTQEGDFYYQGELISRDMPWRLGFEYFIDGRAVSPAELQGSSGDFEMRIKVRQNEAVDPLYFEHYMVQIQVNLDSQYFSQMASEGATIATSGEMRVVNLTSMPGKTADLAITAKVTNAHLGQIQVVGLPFSMMIDMPDPSEYTADLLTLQNAIAELADGVGQFTSGVETVSGAAGQLSTGANTLTSNAELIAGGFDQLAAGRGEFDAALRQYNQGVQAFASGLSGLDGGVSDMTGGVDQLVEGAGGLSGGLTEYSTGMQQFSQGLGESADGSAALATGLGTLTTGLEQLTQQGKYADQNLVGSSAQILAGLQGLEQALQAPLNAEEAAQLTELLDGFTLAFEGFAATVDATDFDTLRTDLNASVTSLDAAASSIEQVSAELLNPDVSTLADPSNPDVQTLLTYMATKGTELASTATELRRIQTELSTLSTEITDLQTSLETVSSQFDELRGLIDRVKVAITAVSPAQIAELQQGVAGMVTNYTLFHDGLVGYVNGVEGAYLGLAGIPEIPAQPGIPGTPAQPGLLAGAQQLSGGLDALNTNGEQLATSAGQLATGAGELHSGLVEFRNGLGQFSGQAGQIVTGAGQLASGGNALVNGHGQLITGENQFGTGIWQYAEGMASYSSGVAQYAQGVGELGSAAPALAGGANQLRDETADMDQQMADRIDDAMAEYLPNDDYELVSFTDAKNNTSIKRVQFIYLIDAQTEPKAAPPPEPDEARSWWQRILDIFR